MTRIGTEDRVRSILAPRIISKLGALVGRKRMDDFVNPKEGVVDKKMFDLHKDLLDSVKDQVLDEYGIDLIDIRLRRFNYPKETSKDIFDSIISERKEKAERYRADGDRLAQNIRNKADEEFAPAWPRPTSSRYGKKRSAMPRTNDVLNEAHQHDKEFYDFLKSMETLANIFSDNRVLLLMSAKRPFFDRFFNPPRLGPDRPANVAPANPGTPAGTNAPPGTKGGK